jgi:quinol monooxygenase YgiN
VTLERRQFLTWHVWAVAGLGGAPALVADQPTGASDMYGLIGRLLAVPGRRDDLIAILVQSVGRMPGCLSYIVAADPGDKDAIWITEAWESEASHKASLSLPQVKEAIAKGKPLIARFAERFVTTPVGGYGLR